MVLTLSQVLYIVLTFLAVVATTILVIFLNQLRKTAREAERTLTKAQQMMDDLKVIQGKLNRSLDDAGQVLQTTKKAAAGAAELATFVSWRLVRPSLKYWPLAFPLIRFGLRQFKKKKKEDKRG
jgi:hypothetical protein